MKLKDIINEEIQKLLESNMVDRAYERIFGMRNQSKEQDRQATMAADSETPTSAMGEYAGDILDVDDEETLSKVYLNPKSLQNFEPDVRAFSGVDGNLFVAQFQGGFPHKDIGYAVRETGRYGNIGNVELPAKYIQWERIGDKDMFGFSITYWSYLETAIESNSKFFEVAKEFIKAVQQKNPQFKMIPMYTHYIKNGWYNIETQELNKPQE